MWKYEVTTVEKSSPLSLQYYLDRNFSHKKIISIILDRNEYIIISKEIERVIPDEDY